MPETRQIAIIGTSLAGVSAAESLRREGFDGRLVMIGSEPGEPYDRPPLSKQVLMGEWDSDRIRLRQPGFFADNEIELRAGTPACDLDVANRQVLLADGSRVAYDGLVIATGASPRRLPVPGWDAPGVHVLRTTEDAAALADLLGRPDLRLVVVGAGFIGSEVAAAARSRGVAVTVLEAAERPLARVFGGFVGDATARLHRAHGVDLRCGVALEAVEPGPLGPTVVLADGTTLAADAVVAGVGAAPRTEWLQSSGLTLADGVVCDKYCFAGPDIVAAGDVARWEHPRLGTLRLEHWTNAAEQGRAAAHNLLVGRAAAIEFAPIPYFWSDQYGIRIQLAGRPSMSDQFEVVDSDEVGGEFAGIYRTPGGQSSAVLGFGARRTFLQLRREFSAQKPAVIGPS